MSSNTVNQPEANSKSGLQTKGKVIVLGSIATSLTNFRADLIRELIARDYSVVAAAPGMDADSASNLMTLGATAKSVALSRTGMNPLSDIGGLYQLWKFLRRERPIAILSYTAKPVVYGMLAAWVACVPIRAALITGLGYSFTEGNEPKRRLARLAAKLLYRLALPRATAAIFQNPDDRKLFVELGLLPQKTPSGVVNGSGVNLARYAVVPLPDRPVFLMIARFIKDKGIREFAKAAVELKTSNPEARVLLVGWRDTSPDSVSEAEVSSWVAAGIENLGRLTDVRPAIAAASVVVLPSYREGTPRSVLEGMSMGRAIITTDVPGCRETVEHGVNGLLVAPRNSQALLHAMQKLATSPAEIRRMGAASRTMAESKYEAGAVARATLDLAGLL